jgi:ribosome-associated heat shock protein Hsp15
MSGAEDRDWQRLDKWLWCARFMKARAECSRLVADGGMRINRQPTDKPHAKLRPGDVLTLPWRGEVRVIEVLALAERRGPAEAARALYREIAAPEQAGRGEVARQQDSCEAGQTVAYRALGFSSTCDQE